MTLTKSGISALQVITLAVLWLLVSPRPAVAHCDNLDGPVVTAARAALEKKDITPVLGWIREEHEPELQAAFQRTLAVRELGPEARELADLSFFETLVRLHRAGEGEPYTGLKPAGSPVPPAVAATDKALETGSIDELVQEITATVSAGLRQRFARTMERKRHAPESVEAARELVASYVDLAHYAERLRLDATAGTAHGDGPAHSAAHDHF